MSVNPSYREYRWTVTDGLIVGCLVLFFLARLVSFWASDVPHLVVQFEDDAYYYFTIARNIVLHHQATFDGMTVTNGFHPLWMILLLPIFSVVHDPLWCLRVVGSLSVILLALGYWSAWRFLHRKFSVLTRSLIMAVALYYAHIFSRTNLDVSLLIPLAVWSLVILAEVDPAHPGRTPNGRFVLVGLLLAALELARLDTVMLNLIIFLTVLVAFGRPISLGKLVRLLAIGGPSLIVGGTYLIVNYLWFGHIVPVSAASKSMSGLPLNYIFLEQLITRPLWMLYLGTLVLSVGTFVMDVVNRRAQTRSGTAQTVDVTGIVVAFLVLYTASQLFLTSWFLWNWYCYPALLATVFVLPIAVEFLWVRLEACFGRLYRLLAGVALVLALTVIAIQTMWQVLWLSRNVEHSFLYQNYVLARLLNERWADLPTVAMGDRAASFAYFYQGKVVQLEGIVGDYQFLRYIERNELDDYLTKHGVGYIVSWTGPEKNYNEWILVNPDPRLSLGPYAKLRLCCQSEFLRLESRAGTVIVWKWPSCHERGEGGDAGCSPDVTAASDRIVNTRVSNSTS